MSSIAALYTIYNEEDCIEYSLKSVYSVVDRIVICHTVGRPWSGVSDPSDRTAELIKNFPDPENKVKIVSDEWLSESDQRQAALDLVKGQVSHCLIIDGDEIYDTSHLTNLKLFMYSSPEIGQLAVEMNTYWKSPLIRIDPPELYTPIIMSRVAHDTRFVDLRKTNEEPARSIERSCGFLYHFSYAKASDKIERKIGNFSHAGEVVPGWFDRVWRRWDEDPLMEDIHPTRPHCYKRAVYDGSRPLPEVMLEHPLVKAGVAPQIRAALILQDERL